MVSPLFVRGLAAALALLLAVPGVAGAVPGWAPGPPMTGMRASHTMILLPSGKVLVAGGTDGDASTASAELFDPVTDAWTGTGALRVSRFGQASALLPDGRVLVAGGFRGSPFSGGGSGTGPVATAELYNPATGTWSDAASMATARVNATATVLKDGRVLVIGGANTLTSEIYEPALNRWTPTANMWTTHTGHTATLLPNGEVLIVGGTPAGDPWRAEGFAPDTGAWVGMSDPGVERTSHAAVLMGDTVLLIGGTIGGTSVASVQRWHGYGFTPAGTMATPRRLPTATLLEDGRVLVAGGAAVNNAFLSSAELYEFAPNRWSPAGSMSTVRVGHQALRLRDGRVLVTGGYTTDPAWTSKTTELYTPATALSVPGTQTSDPRRWIRRVTRRR